MAKGLWTFNDCCQVVCQKVCSDSYFYQNVGVPEFFYINFQVLLLLFAFTQLLINLIIFHKFTGHSVCFLWTDHVPIGLPIFILSIGKSSLYRIEMSPLWLSGRLQIAISESYVFFKLTLPMLFFAILKFYIFICSKDSFSIIQLPVSAPTFK